MTEFIVSAIRFDTTDEHDNKAYAALNQNAKSVFNFIYQLTEISSKNTWKLDLADCCSRVHLTEAEFTEAVNDICKQDYFMYWLPYEQKFVFGNSRMVY